MADYKDRFVAFIRVLGFQELIKDSEGPEGYITPGVILHALEVPNPAESAQIMGRISDISESGHRISAFADNIAITVQPTPVGLLHLLHHVAKIGFRLIRLKTPVFCRGGITSGLVYHDGQAIFGPALDAARSLEGERAKYPRVVLSEDMVRIGLEAEPPLGTIFKRFVHQDEADEAYFVNILRVLRMAMDYEKQPLEHIRAIANHIEKHLQQEIARLSGEERQRFLWFKKYFDWATERSA